MSELVLTDRAALALIDDAERALAEVDNPEDADELWRRVKAVSEAARLARVSEATLVTFRRVQLRAKRRYGELLGPAENHGPATVTARHGSTDGDRKTTERARNLAAIPEPVFTAHLEQSDPDKLSEAGVIREARRDAARVAKPEPVVPAEGTYSTIVIDPPWPMQKIERDVRPNQAQPLDYATMTADELESLAIPADDDAHLYLWTTHKFLPLALELAATWGFTYQCLLTWRKNVGFTPYSFMYSTEHVVFARQGSLDLLVKGRRLDFDAKVREHSRKPDEFYELVRDVSPGPRLDMFARGAHDGFTPWGNETARFTNAA